MGSRTSSQKDTAAWPTRAAAIAALVTEGGNEQAAAGPVDSKNLPPRMISEDNKLPFLLRHFPLSIHTAHDQTQDAAKENTSPVSPQPHYPHLNSKPHMRASNWLNQILTWNPSCKYTGAGSSGFCGGRHHKEIGPLVYKFTTPVPTRKTITAKRTWKPCQAVSLFY